ncbi:MAG: acylphosphatase [Mycetocola sp.]
MEGIRRHAVVSGRVQGVGFRYWTHREAERLGINGWVRNRADGTVEVELEGAPAAVAELVEWLGHGPSGAVVERVEVSDQAPVGESGFRISSDGGGGISGWFRRRGPSSEADTP